MQMADFIIYERIGLILKERLYVHLSVDYETAVKVRQRHGKPVIFQIDMKRMAARLLIRKTRLMCIFQHLNRIEEMQGFCDR